jgi:outer membrane protein OmpA-like peptidoglycan-associated protein
VQEVKQATQLATAFLLAVAWLTGALRAQTTSASLTADRIPIQHGVTVVQAVRGESKVPNPQPAPSGIAVGDHETTLTLAAATSAGVAILFRSFIKDDRGNQRWLSISRYVPRDDLLNGRLQILGFHTDDAQVLPGATAIGPSVAFVRQLARDGRAGHVFRNYASMAEISGTLQRVSTVAFPVLVNGERVTVPALVARGEMGLSGIMRPTEWQFLDHPVHPITLKVSWGPRGASASAPAEWSRQVIRIDFKSSVAERLTTDCRARVPGIYFEFNSDQLNPASTPALETIAQVLRQNSNWTVEIEGHTDNVGGPAYNLDLSARRATSVKRTLVTDYSIAAARLSTRGFGLTRPIESNETVEGRAMNRRVEMVRACK